MCNGGCRWGTRALSYLRTTRKIKCPVNNRKVENSRRPDFVSVEKINTAQLQYFSRHPGRLLQASGRRHSINAMKHEKNVEVKSGKTGTLRSLHHFMDESGSDFALRIYSGNLNTEQITTRNKKKFTLFSVPFYLLHRVQEILP